jgi:ribosome-associated toxin RatA of RatAB toxin-antitoxin module
MVSTEKVFDVDPAVFYQTIQRYEDYPQFVPGVHQVQRSPQNPLLISYVIHLFSKNIRYTLAHEEDPQSLSLKWTLVDDDQNFFFSKNNGLWKVQPSGSGSCHVYYGLDIEFKIQVPQFIISQLVKKNLQEVIAAFGKQSLLNK